MRSVKRFANQVCSTSSELDPFLHTSIPVLLALVPRPWIFGDVSAKWMMMMMMLECHDHDDDDDDDDLTSRGFGKLVV